MGQITARRFGSDEEFLVLAKRAIEEPRSREDIKKVIKTWRADHHRADRGKELFQRGLHRNQVIVY